MADKESTRELLAHIESNPLYFNKKMSEESGNSIGMINLHIKSRVNKGLKNINTLQECLNYSHRNFVAP